MSKSGVDPDELQECLNLEIASALRQWDRLFGPVELDPQTDLLRPSAEFLKSAVTEAQRYFDQAYKTDIRLKGSMPPEIVHVGMVAMGHEIPLFNETNATQIGVSPNVNAQLSPYRAEWILARNRKTSQASLLIPGTDSVLDLFRSVAWDRNWGLNKTVSLEDTGRQIASQHAYVIPTTMGGEISATPADSYVMHRGSGRPDGKKHASSANNFGAILDPLCGEGKPLHGKTLSIYGHSLGAVLAVPMSVQARMAGFGSVKAFGYGGYPCIDDKARKSLADQKIDFTSRSINDDMVASLGTADKNRTEMLHPGTDVRYQTGIKGQPQAGLKHHSMKDYSSLLLNKTPPDTDGKEKL